MSKKNFYKYSGLMVSALAFPLVAFAETADHTVNTMEEVHVYGHQPSLALPITQLDQSELARAQAGNMTKLLETMPGINNASYGEGVGRPVIRGMSANRVKLSVNDATNADVSGMSADHAPMMDIINADNVEIIYGPNTLRFGSGAMGGLVNVKDSRFHDKVFDGTKARVQSSYSSNANAGQAAVSVDIANANDSHTSTNIGHFDAFYRQSDNYSAGEKSGTSQEIDSSSTEALGGSLSYNFVDSENGSIGAALAYTDYEYGLPNDEGIDTTVTPEQWRIDIQGKLVNLSPNFEQWKTTFSYVDYSHEELLDGTPEALFEKTVTELQSTVFLHTSSDWLITTGVQLQHDDFALCHSHSGCTGIPDYSSLSWDGETGANLINDTFGGYSFSHSTPMPLSETLDLGIYLIAGKTIDALTAELGLRYDSRTISTDPSSILPSYRRAANEYKDVSFQPISLSAGLSWDYNTHRVALNLSHSERAPTTDEMYYNGDHHATFSFQLDNPDLDIESANSLDLTWNMSLNKLSINTAVFYYDFSDYIYNDLKAIKDPYHGRDVYRYEQADAWFTGGEISLDLTVTDDWLLFASMDIVKAQLKQGNNKNLPRTPPTTFRGGAKWQAGSWDVEGSFHHFLKQDDITDNETATEAYTTFNAYAAYDWELSQSTLTLQLKANNLLNEFGVNHASYLKDLSPIQGRNIEAGFILHL